MAAIALQMLGGAAFNALAFSQSNYFFSRMGGGDAERKRHDLALEQLTAARNAWEKKRTKTLDYINTKMMKERHSVETFRSIDQALNEYYQISDDESLPYSRYELEREPVLSDFYTPSQQQKNIELGFVVGAVGFTGYLVYNRYL